MFPSGLTDSSGSSGACTLQGAVDQEAETDEEGSDEDGEQAPQNGVEARVSKALVGKATRAKERLSKRVRPCPHCLVAHLQQKRHMPRWHAARLLCLELGTKRL